MKSMSVVTENLKEVLLDWMRNTGDNVPENLTPDWYSRVNGIKIDENFNIRGEMPGDRNKAILINNKE